MEYIEREAAIQAASIWNGDESTEAWIKSALKKLPAADVVEVVRCKDCRFFAPSAYSDDWCSAKSPGVSKGMYTPSGDSYCSDAERMTVDV